MPGVYIIPFLILNFGIKKVLWKKCTWKRKSFFSRDFFLVPVWYFTKTSPEKSHILVCMGTKDIYKHAKKRGNWYRRNPGYICRCLENSPFIKKSLRLDLIFTRLTTFFFRTLITVILIPETFLPKFLFRGFFAGDFLT